MSRQDLKILYLLISIIWWFKRQNALSSRKKIVFQVSFTMRRSYQLRCFCKKTIVFNRSQSRNDCEMFIVFCSFIARTENVMCWWLWARNHKRRELNWKVNIITVNIINSCKEQLWGPQFPLLSQKLWCKTSKKTYPNDLPTNVTVSPSIIWLYSANTALIKLRWRCIYRRIKTELTARPLKRADLNNADNDIQ